MLSGGSRSRSLMARVTYLCTAPRCATRSDTDQPGQDGTKGAPSAPVARRNARTSYQETPIITTTEVPLPASVVLYASFVDLLPLGRC